MKKMAVEPHKHCPICGTPIPLNELVCSPDCQKVWDARLNQRKRSHNLDIYEISDKYDFNIFKYS